MAPLVETTDIRIHRLQLGPFETNCYVVECRTTQESVLIDAPAEPATIRRALEGTDPQYILITHNHRDHLGALEQLASSLKIPVAAHALDAAGLPSPPEKLLKDGDTLPFGRAQLRVLHTPGHTRGSLCFLVDRHLLAGDTIFPGGPGKTGSPADLRQIVESITTKIFTLPDDIQAHPGHGPSTVLGKEKEEFAVFASSSHRPGLCGDVLWLSS